VQGSSCVDAVAQAGPVSHIHSAIQLSVARTVFSVSDSSTLKVLVAAVRALNARRRDEKNRFGRFVSMASRLDRLKHGGPVGRSVGPFAPRAPGRLCPDSSSIVGPLRTTTPVGRPVGDHGTRSVLAAWRSTSQGVATCAHAAVTAGLNRYRFCDCGTESVCFVSSVGRWRQH